MAEPEVLERPPIREALIDLRIPADPSFEVEAFSELWADLEESYPNVLPIHTFTGGLQVNEGDATPIPPEISILGYRLQGSEQRNVVQFRRDGFTFNRLGKYPGWDTVFPEAMRLWERYLTVAQPPTVERLATRFINDIELPFPIELEDILEAPPRIPEQWPQRMVDFITRFALEDESGLTANVTLTPSNISHDAVVLVYDIDVFKGGRFDPQGTEILETFKALRSLKNEIFFGGFTDHAMEILRGTSGE